MNALHRKTFDDNLTTQDIPYANDSKEYPPSIEAASTFASNINHHS